MQFCFNYTVSYPNEESDGAADQTAYIKSASAMAMVKIKDHTYTGDEVRPVPVVKSGKMVLTEGEDYDYKY